MDNTEAAPKVCGNLRCSKPIEVGNRGRYQREFCCRACKDQWANLVRSSCTSAILLLIEHRRQPRMSKLERKRRTERNAEKGLPPPPLPKKGLLTEAIRVIDQFIAVERQILEGALPPDAPRPYEFRKGKGRW